MFQFHWDVLSRDDERAAQDFLNTQFAASKRPDFVGPVRISHLAFGTEPPVVQLMGIAPIQPEVRAAISTQLGRPMETTDDDVQLTVRVAYSGNAEFRIDSEMVVNWPVPGFARLPISLTARGLVFDGVAIVAVSNGAVYFAFQDDGSSGPLKSVTIQTDIGDPTKQVLQDTEQVQRFIVAQLQKIMRKRAVHPSYLPARRPPGSARPLTPR